MTMFNLRRFSSSMGMSYLFCLIISNLIAFVFIGMAFLSEPPPFRYSTFEIILHLALYGFIVSIFFSLISLGIYYSFKRQLKAQLTHPLKFFLIQLAFLFLVFIVVFLSIFLILPSLRS